MKVLLPVFTFLFITLLFLVFLFNRILGIFPNCVYYNPNRDGSAVYLVGKVTGIQEKGNWFIGNLKLCNAGLFSVANVRIYTPKNEAYFDVGEEIVYKGTEGYQWNKVSLDKFVSTVNKNNLFAIRVEELKSKEAVRALFKDLGDFVCQDQNICRNRLEFVETQGLSQSKFLNNLKKRNFLPLFWNFISGEAVIYSSKFGKVESSERFKQLTNGSLL